MKKLILIGFLILAVSLWTAPTASSFPNVPPNGQVPLAGSAIPQFVDQLPFLHIIPDLSLDAQFKGAFSAFPLGPTDGGDVVYLKTAVGGNPPGYYRYSGAAWVPADPIELQMREFLTNILPTGFVPPGIPVGTPFNGTYVWGYLEPGQVGVPANIPSYIGPVIVAKRYHPNATPDPTNGAPTAIKYVNNLGTTATTKVLAWLYSTDQTMHWADPLSNEANDCAMKVSLGSFADNAQSTLYPAPNTLCASNYGENPATHSFVDPTYIAPIPAVVHLHGGEVPPMLDGGPDAWFLSQTPPAGGSMSGHGYYTFGGSQGGVAPGPYAVYKYPNTQEAANIWFHDHVLGITRLNVYAGMAGAYILLDPVTGNANNPAPANLPKGRPVPGTADTEHLIPLVIQDRMFDTNGQLFFPADTANNLLWTTNPEHPYWVPEFVGDTIVVTGKTWPTIGTLAAPLEAKRYRFLFLNGSNARTYELFLPNPITGLNLPMYVIGTDGGYLDAPAPVNKLVIMPGERYDVIIDFASAAPVAPVAFTPLILMNTGRTPFPKGAPPNGTTVGRIVQFFIGPAPATDTSYNPALLPGAPGYVALRSVPTVRLPGAGGPAISPTNVQLTRQLTLNEVMGLPITATDPVTGTAMTAYPGGPLEVVLNNTKWSGERLVASDGSNVPGIPGTVNVALNPIPDSTAFPGANGAKGQIWYTEKPKEGDTEVWEIINITADAHPIHLHLVQFQIINRQNFNVNNYIKAYAIAFGGVVAEAFGPPYPYKNSTNPDFCPANGCTTPPTTVGGNPNINKLIKGKPAYLQGRPSPPLPEEAGWKDTVVSYPGQVLRLAVRWAPTDLPRVDTPTSSMRFPFNPDSGHGYVWHCHIIDHEDNEMMRPTQVLDWGGTRALNIGEHY